MNLWDRLKAAITDTPKDGRKTLKFSGDFDAERRLVRRRQHLIDGFIASDNMFAPRPCTVCDMTALGGKVELWNGDIKSSALADRVKLYITGDRSEVDCKVVWRKDTKIGLEFTSAFHPPTRRYS